jgi:hypothetical protein
MSVSTPSEFSVIDSNNSTTVPLAGLATFTGEFTDVRGYTTITIFVAAAAATQTDGLKLEWSTDGVTPLQTQGFTQPGIVNVAGDNSNGVTVHTPVRAQYFRVKYTNGFSDQAFFEIQTLLRKGPVSGTIAPIFYGVPIDAAVLDAQVSFALPGYQDYRISEFDDFIPQWRLPWGESGRGAPNNGIYPMVEQPIESNRSRQTITAASQAGVWLDPGIGIDRRFVSVFNDTIRGILYLKVTDGSVPSLSSTDFHYKIPSQHTWHMPYSWGTSSHRLRGMWDTADGQALCTEGRHNA